MVFRILNGIMACLFAFGAAVQYNDPDPARWIAVYAAACASSVLAAARTRRRLLLSLSLGVGIIAVAWGVQLVAGVPHLRTYLQMFDSWEMGSRPVEEAREATGLAVIAVWMSVLVLHASRAKEPV